MWSVLLPCLVLSAQALKVVEDRPGLATKDKDSDEIDKDSLESMIGDGGNMIHDELKASDTDTLERTVWIRVAKAPLSTKLVYAASNAGVLAIITWIYHDRGFWTVVAIMGLVLSLSMMSNTIQEVYILGFTYPAFITASHQLLTCLATFAILHVKQGVTGQAITYPKVGTLVKYLAPIAMCFSLSLGCSNLALLHSNTHFYEMLTPMSGVVTFMIGFALGKIKSLKLLAPVLLVAGCLPIVALGEPQMSVLGLVFALLGVLFRSMKAQLNALLMSAGELPQSFHPLELSCWTGALTCTVMLCWSAIAEGKAPYTTIATPSILLALLLSCANATILNVCVLFVMKDIGPVAQQILGELKGALACVGAMAAFGEVIALQQVLGYVLAIIGCYLYNQVDSYVREEDRVTQEKLQKEGQA